MAFAAALCGAQIAAPARAADQPVRLDYALYAGGLKALDIAARLEFGEPGGDYGVRLRVETAGWIARLFPFLMEAQSRGARADGGLAPARYVTANRWGDNGVRWVELTYADAGPPAVRAEPPAEQDDRQVVPAEARRGTVDPVTAVAGLLFAAEDGCDGRAEVFDGRRRYDLVLAGRGRDTIAPDSYASYAGPAQVCELQMRQITGFWEKHDMKRRYPDTVRIWLAEAVAGAPPVPVRLEADTLIGALRVHLVKTARGADAELADSGLLPARKAELGQDLR